MAVLQNDHNTVYTLCIFWLIDITITLDNKVYFSFYEEFILSSVKVITKIWGGKNSNGKK